MQIYANQTLSEAVVLLNAASAQSSVPRVYDDVSDYVTGAVSEQQRDPDCEQEVPRWRHYHVILLPAHRWRILDRSWNRVSGSLQGHQVNSFSQVGIHYSGSKVTNSRENLEWGTLKQIAPPRFCHVWKFQTSDCLHYNVVKNLQPITLVLPKSASLASTKSPLQAENSTFFWREHGQ